MTDDQAAEPARDAALGAAGVLLLVLSIALVYVGGLTLLLSAMAPPMGPEDEVATVSWAIPSAVGILGVPVALARRTTLTRLTLLVIGCATAGPSAYLLARHATSGPLTIDDALLLVALAAGTLSVLVASTGPRAGRGLRRVDAQKSSSP